MELLSAETILSRTQGLLREGSTIRSITGQQSGHRHEFWLLNCEEIIEDQRAGGDLVHRDAASDEWNPHASTCDAFTLKDLRFQSPSLDTGV